MQIVSSAFYDNQLLTADILKLERKAKRPCKWIPISGGEKKHKDRVSTHLLGDS